MAKMFDGSGGCFLDRRKKVFFYKVEVAIGLFMGISIDRRKAFFTFK
jgi:hypothetical protein